MMVSVLFLLQVPGAGHGRRRGVVEVAAVAVAVLAGAARGIRRVAVVRALPAPVPPPIRRESGSLPGRQSGRGGRHRARPHPTAPRRRVRCEVWRNCQLIGIKVV